MKQQPRKQTRTHKTPVPNTRDLRLAWLSCLALNLKRTARVVSAVYEDAVRPSGVRSTQFSILATLAVNPEVSIAELADWVDADRTTIQRSIAIMERQKWILVENASSGNVRKLSLTSAGQKKLAEAYRLWERAQEKMVRALGVESSRKLLGVLRGCRRAVEDPDRISA